MDDIIGGPIRAWGGGGQMQLVARSFAVLAAMLAVLLLPVALVAIWTDDVVSDNEEYVATVAPLSQDPAVQRAVEERLAGAVLDAVPLSGTDRIRDSVDAAIRTVVEGSAFETAWERANSVAQTQLIQVLAEQDSALVVDRGRVSIQLSTLLEDVVPILSRTGLVPEDALEEIRVAFPLMEAEDLTRAQRLYQALEWGTLWFPLAVVVLALSALALAGSRRAMLAGLALGSLVSLGALALGLLGARVYATGQGRSAVEADLVGAVWDAVVERLWTSVTIGAVTAVVLLVVAMLMPRRRRVTASDD